jgi:hypothetical protein
MEKVPVDRIKDLPVDVTVSFSMTPGQSPEAPTPPKSSSAPDICFQSKKGCTISRTFGDEGKYWWDVNLGITLPGIREAKFSFDSKANNVAKSVTRHTDIYAFGSLYPLAYWWRRGSYAPHFDVGIPLTGQPLHRPFFGAAERIPGSKKLLKTPGFFYAGVVRLIEGTPNTLHPGQATDAKTFAADFNPGHVVWKMMYGVEFSVGSLISKVGKK